MAQQERAIRTRKKILVAAAEVFDEVGFEAATIADILTKSGMTKGALYFHFTSKDELAQAVLAEQVIATPVVPERELKLQQSLDESLLLTHLLGRDSGDPIIQGSIRLTVDQGSDKDGLDRRVPMVAWINHTTELLQAAKENGEIIPDTDVPRVAKFMVGSFTGIQVLSRIMTDRADMADRVVDLYRLVMPSIAVPAVLVRLDFSASRGRQIYETAMRERQDTELELAG
ncbi:ScbR family autoregulator-binding transcription factor [Streptomyces sp. NPDC050529]|uniref:ScbR family autoregulator-binding transcription factor n=1 Tax=unclassified Streptomyces TaxID=2593676 RepID=UPI002DD7C626|nr:ScbR family autoregulator-binding transcription factor [Streptomyces sp. NBC_01022]WRZ87501.1 TetR/AcrR family transcriptional regulator [Streptomyces sp. NBC_01022]